MTYEILMALIVCEKDCATEMLSKKDIVMQIKRTCFLLVIVLTCVVGYAGAQNQEGTAVKEQIAIESLLEAIRQASRPADSMRVKWTYETIEPVGSYISKPGWKPPDHPPHTYIEYSAAIRGICSRIESLQKTYATSEKDEPYDVRHSTAVFDGSRQRRLLDRIKGQRTTNLAWQYLRDKNSNFLSKNLTGWPFDLNIKGLIEKYTFGLLDNPNPGIYLLETIEDNGAIYHWTIDGNRGCNVVKIECFRAPNDKDYEVNFKLRQYKDRIWYISEREKIRYPEPAKGGKPRVEHKVRITDVEFGVEVPDDTFVLEFPSGTKVWDDIRQDWFFVGEPATASRRHTLL
ncbi:MAG: hypothetical protein OEW48_18425, partial [Phycisphaerae bacterium]|nr:hypothetical protein [Phycisphaerae bacterium]